MVDLTSFQNNLNDTLRDSVLSIKEEYGHIIFEILPNAIVKSGIKVTSVENPDDNLDSLLGYLVGG